MSIAAPSGPVDAADIIILEQEPGTMNYFKTVIGQVKNVYRYFGLLNMNGNVFMRAIPGGINTAAIFATVATRQEVIDGVATWVTAVVDSNTDEAAPGYTHVAMRTETAGADGKANFFVKQMCCRGAV